MGPAVSDTFLEHRKAQETGHVQATQADDDPMSSLVTVEMNAADSCNRSCQFCPHGDPATYPNRPDWRMAVEIGDIVGASLASFSYKGRISYSGYGEPMLNKDIYGHIAAMRCRLPDNVLEGNTNGDALNAERIKRLFEAGLTYLYVNLYDGPQQTQPFVEMFDEAGISPDRYRLRNRWKAGDGVGIVMNNRGGTLTYEGHAPLQESLRQACNYTGFKLFIDWNGDALFCSNDWRRTIVIGNVRVTPIRDIWLGEKMKELRRKLFYGDRSFAPCNTCDVNGLLHGRPSVERLKKHYGWT